MAVLSSRKRKSDSILDGHIYDRVDDKMWGSHRHKMNRKKEVFHNDYLYIGEDDQDGMYRDVDIGVNKQFINVSSEGFNNEKKHEYFAMNRYLEKIEAEEVTAEIIDIVQEGLEEIQDLLDGEDE